MHNAGKKLKIRLIVDNCKYKKNDRTSKEVYSVRRKGWSSKEIISLSMHARWTCILFIGTFNSQLNENSIVQNQYMYLNRFKFYLKYKHDIVQNQDIYLDRFKLISSTNSIYSFRVYTNLKLCTSTCNIELHLKKRIWPLSWHLKIHISMHSFLFGQNMQFVE